MFQAILWSSSCADLQDVIFQAFRPCKSLLMPSLGPVGSVLAISGPITYFVNNSVAQTKSSGGQALECVFLARPILMMENDIGQFLVKSLSAESDPRAKSQKVQVLRNFHDYLLDVEKQMGEDEDHKQDGRKKEKDKGVPVAAGAGDSISNICWESILDRCLDVHDQVRQASLKVVEIVLRQA